MQDELKRIKLTEQFKQTVPLQSMQPGEQVSHSEVPPGDTFPPVQAVQVKFAKPKLTAQE